MQPTRLTIALVLILSIHDATAGQSLSRLVDTNPAGDGNAWILHRAPTRTWFRGGNQIWRTDGTAAGTRAFHALGGRDVTGLVEIGDRVFLATSLNYADQGLTVLDAAGLPTQLLAGAFGTGYLHELNGQLLFRRTERIGSFPNYTYVTSSWLSDGTPAGTRPAPHIPVDTSINWSPWRLNDYLILTASDPWTSTLYVTDGQFTNVLTTTTRVHSNPGYSATASSTGRRLFFVKRVPSQTSYAYELWSTDGVSAARAYDPTQPGFPSLSMILGCIGEHAYFVGGSTGQDLWKSDGTPAGTSMVMTLPGWPSTNPASPVSVDGGIYFSFRDAAGRAGLEPMFTDGTAAGTVLLGDLTPGPANSDDFTTIPLGGRRALMRGVFAGRDSLWITEGTPASTQRVADLSATFVPSPTYPHSLTRGRYLFVAKDSSGDQEPYVLDGLATAEEIGWGTPRRAYPRLSATPPVLGATLNLRLTEAAANRSGALVFGLDAPWTVRAWSTATLHLDLSLATAVMPMRSDALGTWSASIPVPGNTALSGVTLAVQLAIGPTSTPGLGFDLSNGLLLTPGN